MSGIEHTPQRQQQPDQEQLGAKPGPLVSAALHALETSIANYTQAAELRLLAARERKAARRGMVLDEALIIASANDHLERTGRLPTASCKASLSRYPDWNWVKVNNAGTRGSHGLTKGRTVSHILDSCAQLTEEQIRAAALDYRSRHGRLPTELADEPFPSGIRKDSWRKIDYAARIGARGLAPGGSLSAILRPLREITEAKIIAAAERFRSVHGRLPSNRVLERVPELRNLSWRAIDGLARRGSCGLTPGRSLSAILAPIRPNGLRSSLLGRLKKPPLNEKAIERAAFEHLHAYGKVPSNSSREPLAGLPGESWSAIDEAGRKGQRGLAKGRTVAEIVSAVREEHRRLALLTEEKIVSAAREFFREHRSIPKKHSVAPVPGSPFDSWKRIDTAGRFGLRGLERGRTLSKILHPLRVEIRELGGVLP